MSLSFSAQQRHGTQPENYMQTYSCALVPTQEKKQKIEMNLAPETQFILVSHLISVFSQFYMSLNCMVLEMRCSYMYPIIVQSKQKRMKRVHTLELIQ